MDETDKAFIERVGADPEGANGADYVRLFNLAKWARAVFCFVMTADEVLACIAAPEWQGVKVMATRVDLAAIGEPGGDCGRATAAPNIAHSLHRQAR